MKLTTRRLVLVVGLASLSGACSGGGGDAPSAPPANPYGTGSRLHELIGPATWLDPNDMESLGCEGIPLDRQINVTGVTLTALDTYDETGSGATGNLYVQDSGEPVAYGGVTVFEPGFSPPDLRVVEGDVLDILGVLMEFRGPSVGYFDFCRTLPEMSGALELRFEGAAAAPTVVPVSDFSSYEKARPWFGMLVTVKQLTLIEDPYDPSAPDKGRYSIRFDSGDPSLMGSNIPVINNELFDLKALNEKLIAEGQGLGQGTTLQSVTGIVTYFYGVHLAPRSEADIVL